MDRQEWYVEAVRGNAAHLCVVPVTIEGAVPLLALQNAVVNSRLAVQATADPQGLLQIPGKHLPLPGASLVPIHVVVLGASVLVQQEGVDRHVVDQLQALNISTVVTMLLLGIETSVFLSVTFFADIFAHDLCITQTVTACLGYGNWDTCIFI